MYRHTETFRVTNTCRPPGAVSQHPTPEQQQQAQYAGVANVEAPPPHRDSHLYRQDLDMAEQLQARAEAQKMTHAFWRQANKRSPLADAEEMITTKMLVVEAQRYQHSLGLTLFQDEISCRAQLSGKVDHGETVSDPVQVVLDDLDLLATLSPLEFPDGGLVRFVRRSVLTLPLWAAPLKMSWSE